jgi:hypothetical protein
MSKLWRRCNEGRTRTSAGLRERGRNGGEISGYPLGILETALAGMESTARTACVALAAACATRFAIVARRTA